MHPEGVPLFVTDKRVRPLQGRGMGEGVPCPGALRRADECDPFRVEDVEDEDANTPSQGMPRSSATLNGTVRRRKEKQ